MTERGEREGNAERATGIRLSERQEQTGDWIAPNVIEHKDMHHELPEERFLLGIDLPLRSPPFLCFQAWSLITHQVETSSCVEKYQN